MQVKTFIAGDTKYTMFYAKGKVLGKEKNLETKVSGGGGGGYVHQGTGVSGQVSISSTTVIHDKLYIEQENNKELAIELQGWDIACREGHELLTVWMTKGNAETKSFVAIKNLTTDELKIGEGAINFLADQLDSSLTQNGCAMIFVVGGVGYLLGAMLLGYEWGSIFIPIAIVAYFIYVNSKTNQYKTKSKVIKNELNIFLKSYQ